jgi:hypothetical protein
MDNHIGKGTSFFFTNYSSAVESLGVISTRQNIVFGEYTLPVTQISVNKPKVSERLDFEFKFENSGGYFCLSDGTEIFVPEDDGTNNKKNLIITNDGVWNLGAGDGYFYLRRPGWDVPQKYWVIKFEPGWGKFIDGKPGNR